MGWLQHSHEKSLFGQLLVKKNLISEEQLRRAIEQQRRTGQRLGEIFAEWNAVTHGHVQDALRAQRNLRLAAAVAAVLLGPLEAFAAAPAPVPQVAEPATAAEDSGLRVMTEEDLERVSAQGLSEAILRAMRSSPKDDGVKVLGDIARLMNPLLGLLDADVTMKDVVYDPANAAAVVNRDGSITLRMPSSIGELKFEHIRVRGSAGPSFGSIVMRGIDLTGTTITLSPLQR
ncbi:MAG TPA: hypothetical protein VEC06_21195 [Paucimonas sp.]|nr:hypothetical protein [Paucimonas sp.]